METFSSYYKGLLVSRLPLITLILSHENGQLNKTIIDPLCINVHAILFNKPVIAGVFKFRSYKIYFEKEKLPRKSSVVSSFTLLDNA